jgi:hypothetical protein
MSDITDGLRNYADGPLNAPDDFLIAAADEIDKLRQEIALDEAVYTLVVLERDALREQLTLAEAVRAAQVAGLTEGAEKLREEVKRLTKIIDDAWGEA